MTILSEYSILEAVCKAESSLFDGKVPRELQDCLDQIQKTSAKPTVSDLLTLKSLAKEYFKLQNPVPAIKSIAGESGEKGSTNKRIERINLHLSNSQPSSGPLFDDFDANLLNGMAYDLRVGHQAYLSSKKLPERLDVSESGMLRIEPGDFATLVTHEYIYVPPNLMAFISVRMMYKRKGLVNISGFHVDPNFRGRIFFTVYNAGPREVVLQYKQPAFMIIFEEIDRAFPKKGTEYDGQTELRPEFVAELGGTSVSPRNLDDRLRRLEDRINDVVLPVAVGLIISLVALVVALILKGG